MAKINEEVLHKTIFSENYWPIYLCDTVGSWEMFSLQVRGICIWVVGRARLEDLARRKGFDKWLLYRAELAKVLLHKQIDKKFSNENWNTQLTLKSRQRSQPAFFFASEYK